MKRWIVLWWYAIATAAGAQASGGGLYVAGGNFDFTQAVERALAQNPAPSKFFVLATGDAVRGLSVVAPPELVEVRNRGSARGAVYLVCRRDIEREALPAERPGVRRRGGQRLAAAGQQRVTRRHQLLPRRRRLDVAQLERSAAASAFDLLLSVRSSCTRRLRRRTCTRHD